MYSKLFLGALVLCGLMLLLGSKRYHPLYPQVASTGAPGELTCCQADCHHSGTFTGTVALSGLPDTIETSRLYNLTLTHNSDAVRAGFQLTCLDSQNAKYGYLTAGTGSSLASSVPLARQYVRHSAPKTLNSSTTSWTFAWASQHSIPPGDGSITFYFSSLAANGNTLRSGDTVLLGSKKVYIRTTVPTVEAAEPVVKCYADASRKMLYVELQQMGSAQLRIVDMGGKILLEQTIGPVAEVPLPSLERGVYFAHVQAARKIYVRKFIL